SLPFSEGPAMTPEQKKLIKPVLLTGLAALGGIAFFLYRNKLADARSRPSLKEKFSGYRTALLLLLAPMELGALLLGVFYFLTGLNFFLYLGGLVVVLFAMQWPNQLDIAHALRLGSEERAILDDPNAIVAELSRKP
ncbi:MAG: hypothetical protein ABIO24_12160, partial [Saprospiraceae bacterium]